MYKKRFALVVLIALAAGGLALAGSAGLSAPKAIHPVKQAIPEIVIPKAPAVQLAPKIWHLQEGFEGIWLPAGWDTSSIVPQAGFLACVTVGSWPTCSPHSGTHMVGFNSFSYSTGRVRLITAPVIVNGLSDSLSFWMTHDNGYASSNDRIVVEVMAKPAAGSWGAWTAIDSFSRYQATTVAWVNHALSLGAYNGDSVRVSFTGHTEFGNNMYLDDVAIGSAFTPTPHDISVQSIDVPATAVVPPGVVLNTALTIKNTGTSPESDFNIVYTINDSTGAQVYGTAFPFSTPDTLRPDSIRHQGFSTFTPDPFMKYQVIGWTALAGDSHPENDTLRFSFRTWDLDVGATAIIAPAGTVDPDSTIVTRATYHNFATQTADFDAFFEIYEGASQVYGVSRTITGLAPGADTTLLFSNWTAPHDLGNYSATAYTVMAHDLDAGNDTVVSALMVGYHAFGDVDTTILINTLAAGALAGITFCPMDSNFYFVSMSDDSVYRLNPRTWTWAAAFAVDNSAGEIPWGISWDGTNFWVSQIENSQAYCYDKQYTFAGAYTGTYYDVTGIGGSGWMGGMDFDGTDTWQLAVGGSNKLYRLDLPSGTIVDSIPAVPWATSQRGCSWIPYTSEFVSGGWNDGLIYKISASGSLVGSAAMAGMADVDIYDIIAEGEDLWGLVTLNDANNTIHKVWMDYRRPTGVAGKPAELSQPAAFALQPSYPNPAHSRTTFRFSLPQAGDYSLKVYNLAGQLVRTIAGKGIAGSNRVAWNPEKMADGVYFYRLNAAGNTATGKLVMIK